MKSKAPNLVISTGPFEKRSVDTPTIMRHVFYSLLPVILAAVYFFGMSALLIMLSAVLGCVLTEWLLGGGGSLRDSTVADASALVTGILLALTLPPGLPLWMAFVGGAVAIALGKLLFGGLGYNVFNPSLVGRAFLQACFPVPLTTWAAGSGATGFTALKGDLFAMPFTRAHFDGATAATPLARMKFDGEPTAVAELFSGFIPGSLGETSALLILLGGVYLASRRFLNWRIPVGIFATVFLLATLMHAIDPEKFAGGAHHLFSGGLMLGAVYMATDPVSSPVTPRGCWIFAFGIGVLVIAIRVFGGLPEGVMYAILLMNGAAPLIDNLTQPRTFGARPAKDSDG